MDAFEAFRRLHRPGEPCVFFDGGLASPGGAGADAAAGLTPAEQALRRWSFAAAAPEAGLCVRDGLVWRCGPDLAWTRTDERAWDALRAFARDARDGGSEGEGASEREPGARGAASGGSAGAPFPWGLAGFVGYDAGRLIERLPERAADDAPVPELLFFRFDAALACPWGGEPRVLHRDGACKSAERLRARLAQAPPAFEERGAPEGIRARTSRAEFEEMVRAGKRHVRAGDVFQVNLSHRLETRTQLAPLHLYARLREANPAPFSGYLESGPLPADLRPFHVLSSSPERLFRLQAGRLEARPIAGTRRRGATPGEDAALVKELRGDAKEQAEHVMLVDLARNDLGRVARFGSVHVPTLLSVETYRTVHHLVSVVEADLDEGKDAVDALVAMFPGGTITGAPKVRSMEIIEDLEPVRRGVYTGSLGWIGPTGDCDFNILIRTLVVHDGGAVHLQVGAGIVEDSDPAREREETMAKAQGLLRALREPSE